MRCTAYIDIIQVLFNNNKMTVLLTCTNKIKCVRLKKIAKYSCQKIT
jgi:hypothetical protein